MKDSLLSAERISHTQTLPVLDFGYMGLTRITPDGNDFYGRRLPDNAIVHAHYEERESGWHLVENAEVITADKLTEAACGRKVVGYEDPTYLAAEDNPFAKDENAILASQTYEVTACGKLGCDLVYCAEKAGGEWEVRTLISASELEKLGVAKVIGMVKEAEPFFWNGSWHMLYEYMGDGASSLGYCKVEEDGTLSGHRAFYTAADDSSEHVSTAGLPVFLEDGRILVMFNRRRDREWGISHMVGTSFDSMDSWTISEEFVIRASEEDGKGPHDQRIAFGSCVTEVEPGTVEVLYHVNDIFCGRALVGLQPA